MTIQLEMGTNLLNDLERQTTAVEEGWNSLNAELDSKKKKKDKKKKGSEAPRTIPIDVIEVCIPFAIIQ